VKVLGITENDRTFSIARLFFTLGLGVNLFAPFHVGASTILYSQPPRNRRTCSKPSRATSDLLI